MRLRENQYKRAICQRQIWLVETIVDNSSVKTTKITSFARFQQNTQRNKQILNQANSSIKYIRIHYEGRNNTEEVKQRQKIPLSCLCLQ